MDRISEIIDEAGNRYSDELREYNKNKFIEGLKFATGCKSKFNAEKTDTPIEKMFLIAYTKILRVAEYLDYLGMAFSVHRNIISYPYCCGLRGEDTSFNKNRLFNHLIEEQVGRFDIITTQYQINKYKVDFHIERFSVCQAWDNLVSHKIIVECDGHDFHEKTKEQAKHDKKRDRFLQGLGYAVFRFTGSELYNNPFQCAEEVNSYLNRALEEIISKLPEPIPTEEDIRCAKEMQAIKELMAKHND